MNITINNNGNVTVNATEETRLTNGIQPIDRSDEVLISNDTSFDELIRILSKKPEATKAAKVEAEEKASEARKMELLLELGKDCVPLCGQEGDKLQRKTKRRPGAIQLRTYFPRIAKIDLGDNGLCEVFSNGYAVYDNGDRKAVLWVPECGSYTYYFNQLRDCEKEYQKQKEELSKEFIGALPWYHALRLAGEDKIEYNLEHPRSRNTVSDVDFDEWRSIIPAYRWIGCCHFDNPEEAYLKKEAAQERRRVLSEEQNDAFALYYEEGYKMEEIAEIFGISVPAVHYRLNGAGDKLKKNREKFFYEET